MPKTAIGSRVARVLTTMVGTALGITAISTSAQPQDRRATSIEEVIVTARRVEESLQDTPVSVAAFSSAELEALGVSEAGDVARYTPNLVMRKQTASNDNYAIGIRGVSSGETALAIDPTVGIYQDGVYIARTTGAAFDIVDLQRIEVLRGPQGTLFGRNTIGGAINVITEQPRGEFAFQQKAAYGARGHNNFRTTVDTPKFGDFAAKLSYLRTARDGQLESIYTGEDLGVREGTAYRLALNWSPMETLSIDYTYDVSKRDSNASTQQLSHIRPVYADPSEPNFGGLFYGGPYYDNAELVSDPDRLGKLPIANTSSTETNSDIDGQSLTIAWDATPDLTIKSITGYRHWESKARATDFGSIPAPSDGSLCKSPAPSDYDFLAGTCSDPVPAGTLVPIFGARRDSSQHQLSQELQFIGSLMDGRLNYNGGLYYFEEKADEFNPQSLVLPAEVLASNSPFYPFFPAAGTNTGNSIVISLPFFDYGTDNKSYAIYGQFTYSLLTDLDITLGYRYTIDEKEGELTNTLDAPPGGSGTLKTVTDDDRWTNFNPSLTVDYRWNDQLSTYAKVATGYRSGGYNARATTTATFTTPFDEEEITSYEIGWKSDLLNRTLRINGAIFYMDYQDRQIAQFVAGSGGASTNIVNAGESTTAGLELEVVWLPVTGLRINGSYGYLDVEYDEFRTGRVNPVTGFPTNPGVNEDISDTANENLYAPEQQFSLGIEYQLAPWSFGQLTLRVDGSYTDEIAFHPQFVIDESDEHHLLNARATLSDIRMGNDGVLRISAWGKNLENKEYRDFGIDFGTVGFTTNTFGDLRAWGLDFVYEYNP